MELSLKNRLVFACDAPSVKKRFEFGDATSEALKLINMMGGEIGWIKLNAAFVGGGHELARQVCQSGSFLWLDLKWHDVPDTVKDYIREVIELRYDGLYVDMVNVHAVGGLKMMRMVKEKLDKLFPASSRLRHLVIAITVLTSLD